MFGIELAQARVYQEGEGSLAIELLTRKLGDLTPQLLDRINSLQLDSPRRRYANESNL
jgi:hypothetical protein